MQLLLKVVVLGFEVLELGLELGNLLLRLFFIRLALSDDLAKVLLCLVVVLALLLQLLYFVRLLLDELILRHVVPNELALLQLHIHFDFLGLAASLLKGIENAMIGTVCLDLIATEQMHFRIN